MKDEKRARDDGDQRAPRRIKLDVEGEHKYNEYYYKVSKRYRNLKLITLGVLLLYMIAMLLTYRSQITYENLVYLVKDLDTDVDSVSTVFSDVKYDESPKVSQAIYKGRLAVATTTTFTLFNTTGSAEREYQISMENPKVIAGDKYVMVYDVGGTSYAIYTTIVDVRTKQTEYPIQGAAISDSGAFALITRAREERYLVTFYDANFREMTPKIHKNKYVMDVAMSPDGHHFAVASCEVDGSDVTTEIVSGTCGEADVMTNTVADAMPLRVGFFSDGSFYAVCDSAVAFYDDEGAEVGKAELTGYGISAVSCSGERLLVVESENIVESRNTVRVFSPSGSVILEETEETKIAAGAVGPKYVFLAYDGSLTRIADDGTRESVECPLSANRLVPYMNDVLVCTPSYATSGFAKPEDKESAASEETPDESSEETVDVDFEPVGD